MPEAVLAPGARIECRSAEWLVRSLGRSSDGQQVVDVVGVSPFLREKEARFLVEVEKAAGSFKVLQPEDTALVSDPSPRYRDSLLFIEAHLRRSVPTDNALVVGHRAAMDALPYQLEPAAKALAMPRQRLLIADAVGLGKTLECGILCSEMIRRGRGKRLLVVTTKSMLVQFQKELWTRFSIPLVRLDSVGIQRIREQIPTNQNPFHYYDKAIVSVDTLKNDRDYRFYLDNASWDIIVIDECQNVAERARGAQKSQRARLAERLATRSETLLLLSATPHDGKPESFASLMNMLDPTAIADPSKYSKDDIKDLYVRRFRKDVIADLRSSVKERDTADVECPASEKEERVFALLKDLKLPDSDAKAKAGQLFKTTLAKSLLSSPMAALETVRNRLKRLAAATTPAPADEAALQELEPLLDAIGPADFSKYQRLLQLIRADWGWSGKDPRDRIVLFTGRRGNPALPGGAPRRRPGPAQRRSGGPRWRHAGCGADAGGGAVRPGEGSGADPGGHRGGIRRPEPALPQPPAGARRHPLVADDAAAAQWPHRPLWPEPAAPDPLPAQLLPQRRHGRCGEGAAAAEAQRRAGPAEHRRSSGVPGRLRRRGRGGGDQQGLRERRGGCPGAADGCQRQALSRAGQRRQPV